MKKFVFLMGFLALSVGSFAQQRLAYDYDAAGNRILRITLNMRSSLAQSMDADSLLIEQERERMSIWMNSP